MLTLRRPSLKRVNRILTVVVALLAVYIIAAPFLPEVNWWVRHDSPAKSLVKQPDLTPVAQGEAKPTVQGDVLVVPSIDMQETIHEGANMWMLHYGVWRLPYTSTPDKGGNTVLVGHRFTYTEPQGVFYFLDKIRVGDAITVYWQGKPYEYVVMSTSVVPPTDLAVEAQTTTPRLTLYTCTPLWTAQNRLIVVAEPKGSRG